MKKLAEHLNQRAADEGLPVERLHRQHLLQAILSRWANSNHAAAFVLRGGLLTQLWVGPHRRQTRDIDFLALYPRDSDETMARLQEILRAETEDGVSFDLDTMSSEVIWQESDFPGLRYVLSAALLGNTQEVQIDIGFGDPLVPPAEWIDYSCLVGPSVRIQVVRPELLVAWKLDGLFDHGVKRWLAKDLFDLYLLTRHCQLEPCLLVPGIREAFAAHSDPLEEVPQVLYSRAWWEKEASRSKWARFRAEASVPVPEDLLAVAAAVAQALRPALQELIACPLV